MFELRHLNRKSFFALERQKFLLQFQAVGMLCDRMEAVDVFCIVTEEQTANNCTRYAECQNEKTIWQFIHEWFQTEKFAEMVRFWLANEMWHFHWFASEFPN